MHTKKISTRSKATIGMRWMRSLMDMEMFGYTPKNQPPRYYNTYEKLEQTHNRETFYSYKKNRTIPIKPQKITNYMFANHINRTHNLYYVNKHIKYGNMLINIDIDIKKSKGNGTKLGAQKFANDLKNVFGNNLYIEESTSGSSYHCYIFVNSEHYTYNETKKCLKRLENYLEYYKTKNNHNIELVEIKGHPGIVIYNENNKIDRIKFGQLAKVPFGINNQLKELINTPKITCTEILSSKFDVPEYEIEKEIIIKEIKGSITRKSITKEMLELLPIYANVFDSLFANNIEVYRNNNNPTKGKWILTRNHFAIFVLITKFVKTNNPNNTSTKRFEQLWKSLYKSGDVSLCFNKKIFLHIKKILNEIGFIHWTDHRYDYRPIYNGKGIASEWNTSNQFETLIQEHMYLKEGREEEASCGLHATTPHQKRTGPEARFQSTFYDFRQDAIRDLRRHIEMFVPMAC